MTKAVFLDRDGVVNELVYYAEQEIIDSPFTAGQFRLLPGVAQAIRLLEEHGYLVIIISNQPGIAKGYLTEETFKSVGQKMKSELAKEGASLDGEYYCLHHPQATIEQYRVLCDCRKPEPGLLLKAAREMKIELRHSWMIGDNLSDIKAGKGSGCKTILLGKVKCEICHLMDEQNVRPDKIVAGLLEAAQYIVEKKNGPLL